MDRAIPKTTAPRKIPWGVVVIVIIVLIVLIIASLVVIMSEIDRRKQRGVRCPAAEYYRRNSWLLAPYNVWAASNSAAEPRPWMDMESMFPNGLVLQAGPLARTADRFAAPCGTTWASIRPNSRGGHAAHAASLRRDAGSGERTDPSTARDVAGNLDKIEADPCRLIADGQAYRWRNGEHVLFDDTYMHDVRNLSDQPRVTASAQRFNKWVCTTFGPLSNKVNDRTERRATRKHSQAHAL